MNKLKKIGITGHYANDVAKTHAFEIIRVLEKLGVKVQVSRSFSLAKDSIELSKFDCDLVIAFGGDGTILHTARNLKNVIPILGVNFGDKGYLIDLDYDQFEKNIESIVKGEFEVEKRTRLQVGNSNIPLALNEVLLVPKKTGSLIRYKIELNGKEVWADRSDGIIVATPTGSTGHALSAGGSQILPGTRALSIVSVNSNHMHRRPLIVSDDTEIRITKADEVHECEIVIDGQVRFSSLDSILISKGKPVLIARKIIEGKKVDVKNYSDLSPAGKLILKTLEMQGKLNQKQLVEVTGLPERTVRRNIGKIMKRGLIEIRGSTKDNRMKIYKIKN